MLMLPFTSLVPLLVRGDAATVGENASNNNSSRTSRQSQSKTVDELSTKRVSILSSSDTSQVTCLGERLELNTHPSFVRIFKPRCRSDPFVVTMGELKPARSKDKVRRMHSNRPRIESQIFEPRSLLVKSLVDESLNTYLANLSSWVKFDVFKFDCALSSYHGLCLMAEMAMAIAAHHDLFTRCKVSPSNFYACMREISNNYYRRNPYHTALHACDVLHAMHCLMSEPSNSSILMPLEKLSLIFAAVCHDVAHPGVNQGFIVKTNHVLQSFSRGDNSSLLEKHHFSVGWSILSSFGILHDMDHESVEYLKELLLELILATDIARHGALVEMFGTLSRTGKLDPQGDMTHRRILMCILMKCADISNPCRPWNLCARWSGLICEEFFKQGDTERRLGKPVSNGCDREAFTVSCIQQSFIPNIALPLFAMYNDWSKSALSARLMGNLNSNLVCWSKQNKEQTKQSSAEHDHRESESVMPDTAETSVRDLSSPSEEHSCSASEFDESVFVKRPLFPLTGGANRRKYSMPALFGSSDPSASGYVAIVAGHHPDFSSPLSSSGVNSFSTASPAEHLRSYRRHSVYPTPSTGMSMTYSQHSEILKELERGRHKFVMETVEQSPESSSGESSHPRYPNSELPDGELTLKTYSSSTKPLADGSTSTIRENRLLGADVAAMANKSVSPRRGIEQANASSKPVVARSPTVPPFTVYMSAAAVSNSLSLPAAHSQQLLRRGSADTSLSQYFLGAEHSCPVHLSSPQSRASVPAMSSSPHSRLNTAAESFQSQQLQPGLPRTAVSVGWIIANNSKSTPVVVDDCSSSSRLETACRMKENGSRTGATGKRWSDGCLQLPQMQKALING